MNALALLRQHEPELKKKSGVAKIGIFGSFIRGEERPDSDVDVLVTFRKGEETFDNYMDGKFCLEDLFGRRVDLVMNGAIKKRLKPHILGRGRLCVGLPSIFLMISGRPRGTGDIFCQASPMRKQTKERSSGPNVTLKNSIVI